MRDQIIQIISDTSIYPGEKADRILLAVGMVQPPIAERSVPLTFVEEIERVVNSFSIENESNTPDFILAEYIRDCLSAFARSVTRREEWYGRRDAVVIPPDVEETDEALKARLHRKGISRMLEAGTAIRCQDKDDCGAQCLLPFGHAEDHAFRPDTAAVWWDARPGEEPEEA